MAMTNNMGAKPEFIYCAVDDYGKIKQVQLTTRREKYFQNTKPLKAAIARHNLMHDDDPWRVGKFELKEIPYEDGE